MCDHTNEQDSTIRFLSELVKKLEGELEECKLKDIESRNPGINVDEVRKYRAELKENMKES